MLQTHLGLDLNNGAIAEHGVWASIYNPGKLALLVAWKDAKSADLCTPKPIDGVETLRHRRVRVVRDYGRFDRRKAPQFYEDVKGRETKHPKPVHKADAAASQSWSRRSRAAAICEGRARRPQG